MFFNFPNSNADSLQSPAMFFNCQLSHVNPTTMTLSLCALYPALDKLYPFC